VDKLEHLFEDRVAKALHRLGMPSLLDIQMLNDRVAQLEKQWAALSASAKTNAKAAQSKEAKPMVKSAHPALGKTQLKSGGKTASKVVSKSGLKTASASAKKQRRNSA